MAAVCRTGRLTKSNYESVGRLTGLIEDAAERALRGIEPDEPLPSSEPSRRLSKLGAETFIPALAQVDERGVTVRRVSSWRSFGEEAQELLRRFDRWRLVIRRGMDLGEGTVEVAHEALFVQWKRLQKWLEPEKERLEALHAVESASNVWERRGGDDNGWFTVDGDCGPQEGLRSIRAGRGALVPARGAIWMRAIGPICAPGGLPQQRAPLCFYWHSSQRH